jgi:acetate kinase
VNVLVVNCGSSSLKYSVIDVEKCTELVSGIVERIGAPEGRLKHGSRSIEAHFPDHGRALAAVMGAFAREGPPLEGLGAVAHRVVHGGDRFRAPVLIDDEVVAAIRELGVLAPLHNPVNALGIEVARHSFPDLPHVAIFDTAFHATMPPHAYMYAVPREWGVRRYGFHGTSHKYVAREAARVLDRDVGELDLITLHLGNGASATAVQKGRSIDTSMGLTPLDGLVMGTRSGDVDPALVPHVRRTMGLSVKEIDEVLNTRSGLLALAGDSDLRGVHRRIESGDRDAAVALAVYCYRIRRYVGMYLAAMGGADAIVFTAGVGENDAQVRAKSLEGLERLGIAVDESLNAAGGPCISPPGSPVAVLVIPTDEELEMATQAAALVG